MRSLVIAALLLASGDAFAQEKAELDTDKVEAEKAVYVSGDLAFTRSDVGLLVDHTGFDRTGANGSLYGLGIGLRRKDFRYGVRWRVYDTTEFTLWNISLSAGYALKMRPVTPIFSAHLGYVFDQTMQPGLIRKSLPQGTILAPDPDVKGLLFGLDVNASYWLTKWFRLGAFIGADLMVLSREQVPAPRSLFGPQDAAAQNALYNDSGFGLGLNVILGVRAAFDIGYQ